MKDKFSAVGPRQLAVICILGRETVSETDYEVDLITTLTKLSSLGQQINYEAYTYPIKKVDFSKLKL
ncbi:hypothetical protein M0R45_035550 [Rubus argutus]|uniref:Uncharacterized protein n=1 Tax=Rubus argutus TaxID=59490 RepID=A0AAW1VW09_RUBAR